MIKPLKNFLKLIMFSIMVTACSSQQSISPTTTKVIPEPVQPITVTTEPAKIDDQKFRQGILALEQNELNKAKRLFREFVRTNPNLSGAYINLALIDFKQENYKASLKLTNKAINLNPSNARAYQLRAQLRIKNGHINDAKDDYTKAVEIDPDYANAQYNLALLYDIYLQDISSAISHYETYMTLIKAPDEATEDWIQHLKGTLNND